MREELQIHVRDAARASEQTRQLQARVKSLEEQLEQATELVIEAHEAVEFVARSENGPGQPQSDDDADVLRKAKVTLRLQDAKIHGLEAMARKTSAKCEALERERAEWFRERAELMRRMSEMEAQRSKHPVVVASEREREGATSKMQQHRSTGPTLLVGEHAYSGESAERTQIPSPETTRSSAITPMATLAQSWASSPLSIDSGETGFKGGKNFPTEVNSMPTRCNPPTTPSTSKVSWTRGSLSDIVGKGYTTAQVPVCDAASTAEKASSPELLLSDMCKQVNGTRQLSDKLKASLDMIRRRPAASSSTAFSPIFSSAHEKEGNSVNPMPAHNLTGMPGSTVQREAAEKNVGNGILFHEGDKLLVHF